jgi:hypothetical protein
MAGLEHEMAAENGLGRLRASRADRERVIGTLKTAYVYGLVTKMSSTRESARRSLPAPTPSWP